jgi:hypothetical protein
LTPRIDAGGNRADLPSVTERSYEKLLIPPIEVADDPVDVAVLTGKFGDRLRDQTAPF